MSITQDDFKKIWASTSSVPEYTFSDSDYQDGWEFVGNLPPTRAMWDTLQRRNDQKMKYLQDNGSMCFDSVADMVASNLEAGQTVLTKGYHSVNDGGNAFYYIREKIQSDVDDGGSIIFLDNENVAELITDGTVNVKQFGAKGDNSNDDTDAIKAAINKFDVVYIPSGTYAVTETITLTNYKQLIGENQETARLSIKHAGTAISFANGSRRNVLKLFTIDGNNTATIGIDASGSQYGITENVVITKCTQCAVYANSSVNSAYDHLTVYNRFNNVKIWMPLPLQASTYGIKLMNGSNYNLFDFVSVNNHYYGAYIDDDNALGADCSQNFFNNCDFETVHTGAFINAEDNDFNSCRVEDYTTGFEFGNGTKCKENIIRFPIFYQKAVGGNDFVNANAGKNNVYFYMGDGRAEIDTNMNIRNKGGYNEYFGGFARFYSSDNKPRYQIGLDSNNRFRFYAINNSFYDAFYIPIAVDQNPSIMFQAPIKLLELNTAPTKINGENLGNYSTQRGAVYYNPTINKPVYWNGSNWCTFDGNPVV